MSCQGTVKSFNPGKGFGFVDYNGTDIFVHIKECQGGTPQVGDVLSFNTEESQARPGSMRATNVSGGTGSLDAGKGGGKGNLGVLGNGGCRGMVKSFNEGKGWGFIVDAEGNDIFVHVKDCKGSQPRPGDQVAYDLEESQSKPGSKKAVNVTGGTVPLNLGKGKGKGEAYSPMYDGLAGVPGFGVPYPGTDYQAMAQYAMMAGYGMGYGMGGQFPMPAPAYGMGGGGGGGGKGKGKGGFGKGKGKY